MLLREARRLFFQRGNLGADGGYSSRWVRVESKPIPLYFPNSRSRVAAARLHDLHHIAADYETDWAGEAEISAWEIASGCARYHAAWILDLGGFAVGIVVAPKRLFRAFVRGRRATTNLYHAGFTESLLDETTVAMLRKQLGIKPPSNEARITDIGLFALWGVIAVSMWVLIPILGMTLFWLIIRTWTTFAAEPPGVGHPSSSC